MQPAVYLITNKPYGTLYIGVASNLIQRVWQHREKLGDGFAKQHGLDRLVWYEIHQTMYDAITREKQIKKWNRDWKVNLIQAHNGSWRDLFADICA
jgi:putative endonuclease